MAQMERNAEELAGPNPSPLEKLLAERVAISRFRCYYYECLCAMGLRKDTLNVDDHKHKRLARAQKDFLSACRTLAQVRKLELPFVQVNVAERQQVQNLIVPGGPHERPGDVPAHREPGAVRRNSPQGH